MVHIIKEQESPIIVTLTESVTIDNPYFLFVFYNNETKVTINKIFASSEDESPFPTRYNEFTIPADLFSDAQEGQWSLSVYEQSSSSNEDTANARLIESGIVNLEPAQPKEARKKYKPQSKTIKVYNAG
jgi:hypothetical protein